MSATTSCPSCGVACEPTDKFCGSCGQVLTGSAGGVAPQTVMNIDRDPLASSPPPVDPAAATALAEPAPGRDAKANQTMMGMPAGLGAAGGFAGQAAATTPDAPSSSKRTPAKTMMGMPQGLGAPGGGQANNPAANMAPNATVAGHAQRPSQSNKSNRTMMGLGQAATSIPAFEDHGPVEVPRKSRAPLYILLGVIGVLMLGALGVGAYMLFGPKPPTVAPTVVQTDEGDALQLAIPEAAAGSKVRFAGEERTLESGSVRFPLAADSLRLGQNELDVVVVSPSGDTESVHLALTLEYRVRADLGALRATPPELRIVVDALPGSTVELDGQALELDAQGHGARGYPLASIMPNADAPQIEHLARYTIRTPAGQAHEGEVRTRVPYTNMRLDRPGESLVTDASEVEVAGAVHPTTVVTIGGEVIEVTEGRFVKTVPVAMGDNALELIAHRPGRAPRTTTINVKRVADLAVEAASFNADESLTYARIKENPATYRGQRVAMVGRVYNTEIAAGATTLQLLVSDCPRGVQCDVWVHYPAATTVELNQWVKVLGEVGGEQQYRTTRGTVNTAIRVDATYVLPWRR